MTYGQIPTDHNQAMRDMKRQVDNCPKDQLAGLLKALLDQPEINENPHLLAFIMRGIAPPKRPNSSGGVNTVAILKELTQGMLYLGREGRLGWLRIVSIGEVVNFDSQGAVQYRDAIVQPAFSHQFAESFPIRIFSGDRPFEVKVAVGREPR